PSVITLVQRRLRELGYLNDELDGRMGPATSQALMKFQKFYGLPADGRLTEGTIKKLETHRQLAE
ncbi:MAG: peptidoglycan-binding protein, partial [Proteobacteria bacterium]